jgi:uncharacterized protein (TIGR00251 family)
MAAAANWLSERADGLRVALKVTPRAGRDEVRGVEVDAAGRGHLMVRVTAAPDAGKANAAVLKLLARRWRVPSGTLRLVSGAAARQKVLHLDGTAGELAAHLRAIETPTAVG